MRGDKPTVSGMLIAGRPPKDFFDRFNAIDSISISLARWEMTGFDDEIRMLTASE